MTDWNYIKNQFYKKDQPTQKTDYSQYPTGKTGLSPELKEKVKKGAIATSRPMFRALGVAAWPFARTENILAGTSEPLIRTSGERAGDHIRYVISHLYGIEPPQEIKEAVELKYYPQYFKEKGLPALKQSAKNLGLAIKALQFWKKTPEGVSDFTAVMRGWSEGIYGRELKPGTETNISKIGGVGLSYAITPGATGKALRTVGNLAKTTPLYKLIQKSNLPGWKDALYQHRVDAAERINKAIEIGQGIAQKDLDDIAKSLSKKTGKIITPVAVQGRIAQISKGGLTLQPSLMEKANPVIKEFQANARILRNADIVGKPILSETTYISKLTRAQRASVKNKISIAERKLKRLQTAPHYIKTQEISAKFPGRAEQIKKLETEISDNLNKLYQSEIYGGTEYFPRMYLSKEVKNAGKRFPFWTRFRIRAPYAKKRESFLQTNPEARKMMGEITAEGINSAVQKRLIQQGVDIENAILFKKIADNPTWSNVEQFSNFKQLPNEKAYGVIAGRFVHPRIYSDIKDMVRVHGNIEKLYDIYMGLFKASKTVWVPSLHFRNNLGNLILLDISGTDPLRIPHLIKKAVKEISNNSYDYQIAKRNFMRTNYSQAEILDDLIPATRAMKGGRLERTINSFSKITYQISRKPSDIYGKEEFFSKFIKYLDEIEKGSTSKKAITEANNWLFDYGELATWEKNIAKRIMPFYTFPRKAIPRYIEAMANNPYAIAKYPMMIWGAEKYSLHKLQLTTKDYNNIEKILPDHMKTGSYMLMAYHDKNDDLRFFDYTYLMPWGTIFELQERGLFNTVVTNPLIQLVGDIQRNKDSFTGAPIWLDSDTSEEKFAKILLHFWKTAAPIPPYMPGGIYYDKIYKAITGKSPSPSIYNMDKKQLLPETIAHTLLGLRTQPVDVKIQIIRNAKEKQKLMNEIKFKIQKDLIQAMTGGMTPQKFRKQRQKYIEQMTEILGE